MPGEGRKCARYGGATSCYLVKAGREEIYLDAGSGIAGVKSAPEASVSLLITHMHLDHLVGLPFFAALGNKNRSLEIYAGYHQGLSPKEAIDRLISPPFWPCFIDDYPAKVKFQTLVTAKEINEFAIGEVSVKFMEGAHPNGCTLFRLSYRGKSLVYATDFEHSPEDSARLANFAQGADLLLYDAQYTAAEYEKYRGYGHSTPEEGIEVAKAAAVQKLLLVHHAPWRTDEDLDALEAVFAGQYQEVSFAKIGEEIILGEGEN